VAEVETVMSQQQHYETVQREEEYLLESILLKVKHLLSPDELSLLQRAMGVTVKETQ